MSEIWGALAFEDGYIYAEAKVDATFLDNIKITFEVNNYDSGETLSYSVDDTYLYSSFKVDSDYCYATLFYTGYQWIEGIDEWEVVSETLDTLECNIPSDISDWEMWTKWRELKENDIINITGNEIDEFCDRINQMREAQGALKHDFSFYPIGESHMLITADIYNELWYYIGQWAGNTKYIYQRSDNELQAVIKGDLIYADLFRLLAEDLNRYHSNWDPVDVENERYWQDSEWI